MADTPSPAALISEVGPRDGLQSVKAVIPTADKFKLIGALYAAGLREIEVASFLPARLLPRTADAAVRNIVALRSERAPSVPIEAGIATAFGCTIQGDDRLIAARAPRMAGLPGEPVYGMTPQAGLPKGFVQGAAHA